LLKPSTNAAIKKGGRSTNRFHARVVAMEKSAGTPNRGLSTMKTGIPRQRPNGASNAIAKLLGNGSLHPLIGLQRPPAQR
jgi:hypothetical protein